MQNVLLTGGSNGVGESTAWKFAKSGYNVFIVDKDPKGQAIADSINEELDVTAWFHQADVSDSAQVNAAVASMAERVDGVIDVLVNCAGSVVMVDEHYPSIETLTDEALLKQFSINTFSMYFMCRAVVPYMKERKSGRIINIASLASFGLEANSHYAGSKGAVDALTRSLALELAPDIAVIALAPGLLNTTFIAQLSEAARDKFKSSTLTGKLIDRWEVANQIVHFAHPDNASFTGQVIHFNAGHTRHFRGS